MEGYFIGLTISVIIWGIIWGFATNAVINNKGYYENWFWWGFFFGFIALIVACTKPQMIRQSSSDVSALSRLSQEGYRIGDRVADTKKPALPGPGDWRCACGLINASYVGTCGCGKSRNEVRKNVGPNEDEMINVEIKENANDKDIEYLNLRKLNEYKILFDSSVITEEQFNNKKKELLNV